MSLDFKADTKFSGLGPGLTAILTNRGLLNTQLDLGMKVPNYLLASGYGELEDDWAIMGNLSWQNWERFGLVEVSVNDSTQSLTADLKFEHSGTNAFTARIDVSSAEEQ